MEPTILDLATEADERGFSIKPFEGKQLDAVFNIHIVSLTPGTTRGNHFHPTQTEYIFVMGKQAKLVTVDTKNNGKFENLINSNDTYSTNDNKLSIKLKANTAIMVKLIK